MSQEIDWKEFLFHTFEKESYGIYSLLSRTLLVVVITRHLEHFMENLVHLLSLVTHQLQQRRM